jgi:hypothetical protein
VTWERSPSSFTVLEQARLGSTITASPLRSMPGMKTSMRNISKVKQSRLKPSRPLPSQSRCVATNSCRLGEARSLGQIVTTLSQRLGDAFATFNFRYRSHSKFSFEATQVQYLPWQRTCKSSVSSQEAQLPFHWKTDHRKVSTERSFSNCCVDRRYVQILK